MRSGRRDAVLLPLVLAGTAFMGFDFVAIERGPLRRLGIAYPAVLDVSPWLIAIACGVGWFVARRRWPVAAGLVAFVVCVGLMSRIPAMFHARTARVPLTSYLSSATFAEIETRLGVAVTATNSSDEGPVLCVAFEHEAAARAELARIGRLPG